VHAQTKLEFESSYSVKVQAEHNDEMLN